MSQNVDNWLTPYLVKLHNIYMNLNWRVKKYFKNVLSERIKSEVTVSSLPKVIEYCKYKMHPSTDTFLYSSKLKTTNWCTLNSCPELQYNYKFTFQTNDFSLWKIELHILVYHTLSYKSSNKTLCDKTFLAPNLSTDKFCFPCENIVTLARKKMLFSEASFCKKSLRPTNLKTRTAMNAKISVFLICVEVNIICYYIIWWLEFLTLELLSFWKISK